MKKKAAKIKTEDASIHFTTAFVTNIKILRKLLAKIHLKPLTIPKEKARIFAMIDFLLVETKTIKTLTQANKNQVAMINYSLGGVKKVVNKLEAETEDWISILKEKKEPLKKKKAIVKKKKK